MRRKIVVTSFVLTLLIMGCEKNMDNNRGPEFDELNVNFSGELAGREWSEGDEIGIYSFCTRKDEQNVPMSVNAHAKHVARIADDGVYFTEASDDDQVTGMVGDHNFKIYAYFPYASGNTDMSAIDVQVPARQSYSADFKSYGLYVASQQVTTVVPTVELDFQGVFSNVELYLPGDIIDEDGNSVIQSLTLKAAVPENFNGTLADGGTYNLETNVFTSDGSRRSKEIKLDFGEEGIVLADAYTKVSLAVAPFVVPAGGMDVVIQDLSGNETIINILGDEQDEGTELLAGEVLEHYLSRSGDEIIPVTFPVVFPLGKTGDVANFTASTQPKWVSEGIWTCPAQPQAYAQWYKVSDPSPTISQYLEIVNSGSISSPGIKGIWTGDYLEFVLPVKDFAAGTIVAVKLPMYTRQGPVFWNIEYLDGEEWKSNTTDVTSYDPAYTREATFSLVRGGKIIEHTMVFTKAIESGHIKIRITCADGSIQADTDTELAVRDTPWTRNSSYGAPFYFYLEGSDVTSVTFSMN